MILHDLHRLHHRPAVTTNAPLRTTTARLAVHHMVQDRPLRNLFQPPFGLKDDSTANIPANGVVVPPVVHLETESPATVPCGEEQNMVVPWGPGGRKSGTPAAREPIGPSVEIRQCSVHDVDRGPDEHRIVHVTVTSATKARIRSSSTSAS